MIAVVFATVLALCSGFLAWRVDQRTLRCGTPTRAKVAAAVITLGVWVCVLIQAMLIFKVPGAYGPVQYWELGDATRMHGPRMLALLMVFLGYGLSAVTAILYVAAQISSRGTQRWRTAMMPVVSIAVIALAGHWYGIYGLLPTA